MGDIVLNTMDINNDSFDMDTKLNIMSGAGKKSAVILENIKQELNASFIDKAIEPNGITEVADNGDKVQKTDKETDDWEVVEASSDESEVSGTTEFDIMVPIKMLDAPSQCVKTNPPAPTPSQEVITNEDDCIVVAVDEENSTQTTQPEPVVKEKKKEKTKKRKFKLFTGESSDEEVVAKEPEIRNQPAKQINIKESTLKHGVVQGEHVRETDRADEVVSKNNETFTKNRHNQVVLKSNETFTKSRQKSHSDTEVADDNMVQTRRHPKPPNMSYILEESDDEIVEVPRSPPHTTKSSSRHAHSSNQTITTSRSHKRDCQCSCVPVNGSPDPKRVKRQKLMDHMWQEREQKLKLKMVKKVKDVFFKVLESLVSSEESDLSGSDEEAHARELLRKRKQGEHRFARPEPVREPDTVRDLKREIQYWKRKAAPKPVLSPHEIQLREMKADLDYWKRVAMSKAEDMPSSSIGRTSTPVKEFEEERPLRRPTGAARVTSSGDTSHFGWKPPPREDTSRLDFSVQDVMAPSQDTSVLSRERRNTFNPASSRTSQALSVMSRTKFTEKEKEAIVEYLVKNYDSLELIRGNMFWMQMAHELDTHRSWHSLKNNFFTNIMKNLEQYEMPDKVRNKIISLAKQYM